MIKKFDYPIVVAKKIVKDGVTFINYFLYTSEFCHIPIKPVFKNGYYALQAIAIIDEDLREDL